MTNRPGYTMKWNKLGKIYDPREFKLSDRTFEYAQAPQVLDFDDYIRIYFSTREKDKAGKYISRISFIDMDKNLEKIIDGAREPVIPLGELGCFDEHGIFPFNVLRHNHEIFAYTCGWSRRKSVAVETSIGLAKSNDNGMTFQRCGKGPILTSSLYEPFLVGDPFVRVYSGFFHMWYIYGTRWLDQPNEETHARVYKIGHAISTDGITWQKEGKQIVPDKLNPDECQALPTVIFFENRYHMFYCYRQATDFRKNKNRGYRIGYAFSEDLEHWTRDDSRAGIDFSETGWDSEMQCYPHVFQHGERIYLLYNGNEFGRFGFGLALLEKP